MVTLSILIHQHMLFSGLVLLLFLCMAAAVMRTWWTLHGSFLDVVLDIVV